MDVMNFTEARAQFKTVMDKAIHDHEEVVVTRRNNESVVVVSLETWNAIQETMYLLDRPRNAGRLRESVAQLDAGHGQERELVENARRRCEGTPFE